MADPREFQARESHRDAATVYVRPELVVELSVSLVLRQKLLTNVAIAGS